MEKAADLYSSINPPSGNERKDDHEEHTRKLLFELLRQRGIDIDSETGRKLDGKSDIETLLRVIQNEKKKKKKINMKFHQTIMPPSSNLQSHRYKYNTNSLMSFGILFFN